MGAYCIAIISFRYKTHSTFPILECAGPLSPEVVQSTALSSRYPASNVLILGETDANLGNGKYNFWLAGINGWRGFILRIDYCKRLIAGFQIKNLGKGCCRVSATDQFQIGGSTKENGPWKILADYHLDDTRGKPAPLLNFTFDEPVEIQFIYFELVSYWPGVTDPSWGNRGGLQYFAAIPATSK